MTRVVVHRSLVPRRSGPERQCRVLAATWRQRSGFCARLSCCRWHGGCCEHILLIPECHR